MKRGFGAFGTAFARALSRVVPLVDRDLTMQDIYQVSATELARRVREGELRSIDLVDACIAAIERVNPALNAVVATRFREARNEAHAADQKLKDVGPTKVGPLHGVPCSIKESFALTGMPNTSGLRARVGLLADADATAVARLRAAGAIPLGVTNTSELCMWMESSNRVYGRTNNPYALDRIVGGSSGGEGAIIASGAVPFGLGSDVGGSIRMPAFFNGIFGHKASSALVPNTGQFPITQGEGLRYLATGPMARHAEDLWLLLDILKGPDGADEICEERALPHPDTVDLSTLRVMSVETNHLRRPSRALRHAQRDALERLAPLVDSVAHTDIPEFRKSPLYWGAMLGSSPGPSFAEMLGVTGLRAVGQELFELLRGRSSHTLPAIALALLDGPNTPRGKRTQRAIIEGRRFRDSLNETLGEDGVMLFPSYPSVAPKHHWPQARLLDWLYTAIFNATEMPVTQVPLGLDDNGLPVGVQVVAAHGNDHLCLAVALALEKAFGGWQPPERTQSMLEACLDDATTRADTP